MGLFDFFKKKEVLVNSPVEETKKNELPKQADVPIEETKKDEPITKETLKSEEKNVTPNLKELIVYSDSIASIIIIKGLKTDIEDSEIVDIEAHDEISDEAKELTKSYVKSLTGQVFYSHKKFFKLQDSPYKCKDKDKTKVWLYPLIDYDMQTVILKYNGKELVELVCKEIPEWNTTDREKLIIIAKEVKSN